jgi:tetratricopeptide (TPR) repeat protein
VVAYSRQKFGVAFEHFTKAIISNPKCGASVRVAVAACSFRLENYDKAKMALEKALTIDVRYL